MNKNKGIIGIGLILAIVLGIVVVGGAYYFGKSNYNSYMNNSIVGQKQEVPVVDNNQPVNVASECTPNSIPSIKVLSPNGGEIYKAGDKITVKWESCNNPYNPKQVIVSLDDPVGFRYYLSGNHLDNVGTTDTGILTTTLPNVGYVSTNSGSPINFKLGNNFTVMVSAWPQEYEPIWDFSDNPFTINSEQVSPNTNLKLLSFKANKEQFLAETGRLINSPSAEIKVYYLPTGTGMTEPLLLGLMAPLTGASGSVQTWSLSTYIQPYTSNKTPIMATSIYATLYIGGKEINTIKYPITGANAIYESLYVNIQ